MSTDAALSTAVAEFASVLAAHPERRSDLAQEAVMRGERRAHPAFYLGIGPDPKAPPGPRPTVPPPARSPEQRLLDQVRGRTGAPAMLNPISPHLGLGKGPGTLAASFGIFLDPELGYTPNGSRPLEDVLAEGMPDPATSGLLPQIREDIAAALALTPDWIKISLPDMQGPFNIAHMVLGDQAFFASAESPEAFHRFMDIVTDFYLAVDRNLRAQIGAARLHCFPYAAPRIAECSVNLVSTDFYEEFIKPCDLRIAAAHGMVAIHPCSGPHVFHATLSGLPGVVYTEAGFVEKACAGAISVDAALAAIGRRPIILNIGQELPPGEEEAFIRRDFDRARTNHRLLFGYTGMHWRQSDAPMVRDLHRRLDDYWAAAN